MCREAQEVLRLPVRGSEVLRNMPQSLGKAGARGRTLPRRRQTLQPHLPHESGRPDRGDCPGVGGHATICPSGLPGTGRGRRWVRGERLPTPNEMRANDRIPYRTAPVFPSGWIRQLEYMETKPMLLRPRTRSRRTRLLIRTRVAPLRGSSAPSGQRSVKRPHSSCFRSTWIGGRARRIIAPNRTCSA